MKPLYILDRYDGSVRRERATPTEIRDIIAGKRNDRLAHIDIVDGELVTHELTADELKAIAAEVDADAARRLHALLDATVTLAKQLRAFDGISFGASYGVLTIWNWSNHDNEANARFALAWAELRGYEVKRNSPPPIGQSYYPDATITVDGIDVCRIVWDSVECNTDAVVEKEIADVHNERSVAERELQEIPF